MKTSRSGSRSGWLSNQSRRFFRTSGRSCSMACPVFFARQAVALEEPRKCGGRRGDAALGQAGAELLEALIALLLERHHDDRALRLDPTRPHVAALRLRREAARSAPRRIPADHRRHRHAETPRRRATAHAAVDRCKRPRPQIHRKWFAHPAAPISAAGTENQTRANLGIPHSDSDRKGDALTYVLFERRETDYQSSAILRIEQSAPFLTTDGTSCATIEDLDIRAELGATRERAVDRLKGQISPPCSIPQMCLTNADGEQELQSHSIVCSTALTSIDNFDERSAS